MTIPDAVVLDLDGSIGPIAGEQRLALRDWQEPIRFGCSLKQFRRFAQHLQRLWPLQLANPTVAPVLLGSGDFHHLTWLLVQRYLQAVRQAGRAEYTPIRVVVLDNHPDNMRYWFGIHCGSWVRRLALMPEVSHVYVIGITSTDIAATHAWENYWHPLRCGKLSYWSLGPSIDWIRQLNAQHASYAFTQPQELVDQLCTMLQAQPQATYLSIDKDVFSTEVIQTNWDQGQLQAQHALDIIQALQHQLIGCDITGEISSYRYRSRFKRWLSAYDGQTSGVSAEALNAAQQQQHAFNQTLLSALQASYQLS